MMVEMDEGIVKEGNLAQEDAVRFELHASTFRDSTSDGIRDCRSHALSSIYLRDTGLTALSISPFYPFSESRRH